MIKYSLTALTFFTLSCLTIHAQEEDKRNAIIEKHTQGAKELTLDQDDLSADVQDLIDEQTDPEMIKVMREIEIVMADAIDLLDEGKTGGETIATETEIIEKIFEAAKKKQQQSGEG